MEAPASPTPPSLEDPSQPRECPERPERRGRKTAFSHIFQGASLQQIRGLFHAAGDQKAERRAAVVWAQSLIGQRPRTQRWRWRWRRRLMIGQRTQRRRGKLAQAPIGRRTRGRRSRPRAEVTGEAARPACLRSFGHLRINEGVVSSADEGCVVEGETEARTAQQGAAESEGDMEALAESSSDSEPRPDTPRGRLWGGAGSQTQGGERTSEHYLHRILH
ncbi:uncharacterized protein LOC133118304 [Conger conger]|uniref:uncharacterized protein LOC133118304 n=1 Tax=Conger conger TaxID=82655 RepID=UPI002A5AE19B|nr:uncharacterized protein LOC133118304 [Conger conger]